MAKTNITKADCLKDLKQYPWAEYMTDEDFISSGPSYECGKYLNLFEDKVYRTGDKRIGDLRYFVYDPVKHGMPENRSYPVIYALHGSGGSLVGKTAVNWAGAEMFASPEYQEMLGGAYIVAPLANEYRGEDGRTMMTWMTPVEGENYPGFNAEDRARVERMKETGRDMSMLAGKNSVYTEALFELIRDELKNKPYVGKRILFGTSAGGFGAWRMLISEPDYFDAVLMMAGAYLPSIAELERIEKAGTKIFFCHGKQDELVPFEYFIRPILSKLETMRNVEMFFPEMVRRADGGIAVNGGIDSVQMGQHCINDVVSENLMFLDGTPVDPGHPEGAIGWIKSV